MQKGGLRCKDLGNNAPLVSIVCVSLNAAKTIEKLFESIRNKRRELFEVIVIDGGSTDGTIEILKKHEHIIDFWISEKDEGIYNAMNKAITYTKGKWIIFAGADDLLARDFDQMLPYLVDPKVIYYGNVLFYGKEFVREYDDYFLTKLNICHQGIFYPKTVFEKYHYDQRYPVYADYHLNLRCWKDPEFSFVHVDCLVASFTAGGFSSNTKDLAFEREKNQLFKEYLKPSSYYRYLNRTVGAFGMLKQLILSR